MLPLCVTVRSGALNMALAHLFFWPQKNKIFMCLKRADSFAMYFHIWHNVCKCDDHKITQRTSERRKKKNNTQTSQTPMMESKPLKKNLGFHLRHLGPCVIVICLLLMRLRISSYWYCFFRRTAIFSAVLNIRAYY